MSASSSPSALFHAESRRGASRLWLAEFARGAYCPPVLVDVRGARRRKNPAVSQTDTRGEYSVFFNRLEGGRERLYQLDATRVLRGE